MQHSSPIKSFATATCLLAMLVAGCATPAVPGSAPASVARAELLLQQGNPAAAAQMYEQLSLNNPPPERNDLALAGARAWLSANRVDDAQRLVDAAGSGLTPAQRLERERVRSELAVARAQRASAPPQQTPRITEPARPIVAVANVSPIALLLPLTGRQAVPAGLVRDGFLAAVARLPEAARPSVRIYDTGAVALDAALQTARAEGAGFLVGPLTREEVQSAVGQRPGNLPWLLLNNLAGGGFAGANLYQYALAPEDEARQIARQMADLGQRNVVMLAPTGDWGTRVATAFVQELTRGGGHIVAQGNYQPGSNDLEARVNAVLGIDDSRDRQQKVKKIIGGELEFVPRPRPDIDAIFVAGRQPVDLRQINPPLHRHAENIPTYMTQDGLAPDTRDNRDLAGMRVPVTPWMLDSAGPAAAVRAATEPIWAERGIPESRLFAFGHDAATLVLTIRGGSTTPLSGLTGRLTLTPEGRVERNLSWARVGGDGSLQAADPAAR